MKFIALIIFSIYTTLAASQSYSILGFCSNGTRILPDNCFSSITLAEEYVGSECNNQINNAFFQSFDNSTDCETFMDQFLTQFIQAALQATNSGNPAQNQTLLEANCQCQGFVANMTQNLITLANGIDKGCDEILDYMSSKAISYLCDAVLSETSFFAQIICSAVSKLGTMVMDSVFFKPLCNLIEDAIEDGYSISNYTVLNALQQANISGYVCGNLMANNVNSGGFQQANSALQNGWGNVPIFSGVCQVSVNCSTRYDCNQVVFGDFCMETNNECGCTNNQQCNYGMECNITQNLCYSSISFCVEDTDCTNVGAGVLCLYGSCGCNSNSNCMYGLFCDTNHMCNPYMNPYNPNPEPGFGENLGFEIRILVIGLLYMLII